ncbi:hypothetical protein [Bellilinea sp.]|uniref:hypothetical protein n=1 Tax=Bellilinea sp. TaxID=2838785 RepID=UPI002ADE49F8|nr:hypothetical protein [Bellilinea sp.]
MIVGVGVMLEVGMCVSVGREVKVDVGGIVTVGVESGRMMFPIVNTPQQIVTTPNNIRIGIAILVLGFLNI